VFGDSPQGLQYQFVNTDREHRLTRLFSFALRHRPADFGLQIDRSGWVNLDSLVAALSKRDHWKNLTSEEVREFVKRQPIERFEISGDSIRALYGHSTPGVDVGEYATPPPLLYHATRAAAFTAIREKGLAPGTRQRAHLAASLEYALSLKTSYDRRGTPGLILCIETALALRAAIPFCKATEVVWTAPYIPPSTIFLLLAPSDPNSLRMPIVNADSVVPLDDHVASSLAQLDSTDDDRKR
jgi:putative RNA 2'-phosphotransferase